MSDGLLRWRFARREDRADLQAFCCTEKAVKRPSQGYKPDHPRIWEWELQAQIRDLRPPYEAPTFLLLGRDDDGLAAVSLFEELDGPAQVELLCMAVALRLRFRGGGFADELAVRTFEEIQERAIAAEQRVVSLSTLVDEGNRASQSLCRRMGMEHRSMSPDGLQRWAAEVLIPAAGEADDGA